MINKSFEKQVRITKTINDFDARFFYENEDDDDVCVSVCNAHCACERLCLFKF